MPCSVPGCDLKLKAKGLCGGHYLRLIRRGDVFPEIPFKAVFSLVPKEKRKCIVSGCERKSRRRGYCEAHAARLRVAGDLQEDIPIGRFRGGSVCRGYRYLRVNKQSVAEHRIVMENMLQRKLTSQETVHHIDGNGLNNDPPNLELWTSRHPKGQRVEDLVSFAIEVLKAYRPEALTGLT